MKLKRQLLVALLLSAAVFGGVRGGAAARTKVYVYSLAELVEKADAVVVAKMSVEGGAARATVLRALKGDPSHTFNVRSFHLKESDRATFADGETVILFTGKEEGGSRKLLGYGDQGKWPKADGRWPYTDQHVAPLAKVEATVKQLLELQALGGAVRGIGRLSEMLSAEDGFSQIVALEYVQRAHDRQVFQVLRPKISALSKSDKSAVRGKAQSMLDHAAISNY
jgi:hypothetical protein